MSKETFPLCDLCGEHHEMLVGEKRDECPEAWAVEHLKQYELMYLKWCESESKIQDLEAKLDKAVEALKSIANLEAVDKELDASVWFAKTAIQARQALEEIEEKGE